MIHGRLYSILQVCLSELKNKTTIAYILYKNYHDCTKQAVRVVNKPLDWQSEETESISPASGTSYMCDFRQPRKLSEAWLLIY